MTRDDAIEAQFLLSLAGYKTFRRAPAQNNQYIEVLDAQDRVCRVFLALEPVQVFLAVRS